MSSTDSKEFDYFAHILLLEEMSWSRCKRKAVSCVVVQWGSQCWVAAHNEQPHPDTQCQGGPPGLCGCRHAEMNPNLDLFLDGSTVYVTASPCLICAQHLVAAGVSEVVYLEEYRDPRGLEYLRTNDVTVRQYVES